MFLFREIIGWLLVAVAVGLIVWGMMFLQVEDRTPQVVEAGLAIFGAGIVMRAGILLIRVSAAVRIIENEAAPR